MFQTGVNVSGRYRKWPVFSRPLMAGFGRPPRPFGPAVAASLRPLADPVLSERPLWPRGNPAVLYLASLGSASARRTMRSAVGNLAGLLGCDSFEAAPWPLLRYAHVVALRAALVSLRFAPATVNRHLAALRGVVRQAWRLGYIAPDDYQRMSDIPGVRGTRLLTGRALSYPELEALNWFGQVVRKV